MKAAPAMQNKAGLSALEPASGHDINYLKAAQNRRKPYKTRSFLDTTTIWARTNASKAAAAAALIKEQLSFRRAKIASNASSRCSTDCIVTLQADASAQVHIITNSTAADPRRSLDNAAHTIDQQASSAKHLISSFYKRTKSIGGSTSKKLLALFQFGKTTAADPVPASHSCSQDDSSVVDRSIDVCEGLTNKANNLKQLGATVGTMAGHVPTFAAAHSSELAFLEPTTDRMKSQTTGLVTKFLRPYPGRHEGCMYWGDRRTGAVEDKGLQAVVAAFHKMAPLCLDLNRCMAACTKDEQDFVKTHCGLPSPRYGGKYTPCDFLHLPAASMDTSSGCWNDPAGTIYCNKGQLWVRYRFVDDNGKEACCWDTTYLRPATQKPVKRYIQSFIVCAAQDRTTMYY